MSSGLRDRKKQRTRAHLAHVATVLFIEHGFDRITIADVADAADVAKNTVTNHFPLKEDLVFDAHADVVDSLAAVVRGRLPGESALGALRREYLASLGGFDVLNGLCTPEFARLVTEHPRLRARERELDELRETALAEALVDDAEGDAGGVAPTLVAAHLAAIQRPLIRRGRELVRAGLRVDGGTRADSVRATLAPLARTAFDLVDPVLRDVFVRPGARPGT